MSIAVFAIRQKLKAHQDNDFLAPALEILETPMSPVRTALILTICALVACSLTWSYFGRIDIVATAQGKIEPAGRVKVIEPLETGKLSQIIAGNGAHVGKGDVLIEMDASEIQADRRGASDGLDSAKAEAQRRRAALVAVETQKIDDPTPIAWGSEVPEILKMRENRILKAEMSQLSGALASLRAQQRQKEAERDELKQTLKNQIGLIATLQDRVDMKQTLLDHGTGARAGVIDATETLQVQKTQLGSIREQLASAESSLAIYSRDSDKAIEAFVSDNAQKISDAERKIEELTQTLAKANARLSHMTLSSPIDGVVQASVATNVGQVVSAGQEVMRVVPENAGIEVEAYVTNEDIGFIKEGQEASLKIASFPFLRYGTIKAHVTAIARDAIPELDANAKEGDGAHATASSGFAGAQRMQNLVFLVTLKPDTTNIAADGETIPLGSGMATTVEFKTGNRRIIEYIFSPVVEVAATAMHER